MPAASTLFANANARRRITFEALKDGGSVAGALINNMGYVQPRGPGNAILAAMAPAIHKVASLSVALYKIARSLPILDVGVWK